ncbi:hypothetical protein, partial [Marinomonas transparens]
LSDSSAETGTMTYVYDSYGRLWSQTDATGRTVMRTYDVRSRILRQRASEHAAANDYTETIYTYQDSDYWGKAFFGRLESTTVKRNSQAFVKNLYRYNLKGLKIQHYYYTDLNNSGNYNDAQETHLIEFSYDAMDQLA